jgi:phage-related protein
VAFQSGAFQSGAFQVTVAGVGGAGAATFAMAVEAGASVTYEWKTDITTSLSGLEQRAATRAKPRQRYAFSSLLSDAQHRAVLETLAEHAVEAPLFLLGLAFEDLVVVSSTTGAITTHGLSLCDWAVPGQRVVVVSPAGVTGEAVVQATVGAAINVDADLTAVAVEGARIMPAMGVYLDPDQALGRHRARLGRWDLSARAERNGFAPGSTVGTGATVTTFDGLAVWDVGVGGRFAAQPLHAGSSIVDLGGRISTLQAYSRASWSRAVQIQGERTRWQWFKAFLHAVQGCRAAWLLPTGRPDLVPVGDASSGTLTIVGPTAGGVDYAGVWFPSLAHRRLKLVKADGSVAYREVSSCADAGATQDLTLDSALAGALSRVEFLEQVRLESDEVTVTWDGVRFEATLGARVVQQ